MVDFYYIVFDDFIVLPRAWFYNDLLMFRPHSLVVKFHDVIYILIYFFSPSWGLWMITMSLGSHSLIFIFVSIWLYYKYDIYMLYFILGVTELCWYVIAVVMRSDLITTGYCHCWINADISVVLGQSWRRSSAYIYSLFLLFIPSYIMQLSLFLLFCLIVFVIIICLCCFTITRGWMTKPK